ncbi:AraC family transcriptional regulator [uncultured Bilophila sp.]|uniref:helix-turn-helix transcriptional regulator n=1 Tax=uncultured Bilophila sp. TaxID=529385 RepID=UPI0026DD65D4|nr:AraC family transcriptional regulator [uncultured Bilophila sp.]
MSIHIDFLSYDGERNNERHPHAQFVLPIAGELRIDIGGAEGMLDPSRAAFVAPGVRHSQLATGSNRFLIVNCDPAECGVPVAERLAEQVFLPVSEAMRHLIGFANLSRDRFALPGMPQCWMPLLIDSIFGHERRTSRLDELAERIEADLSAPWTVEEMARRIGLSPSRLHALFRSEWGTSPQAWLAERRIRRVQTWLAASDAPIAELAQRAGYADQSALTRAMQRLTGLTPAAYRKRRRLEQKNGSLGQDALILP